MSGWKMNSVDRGLMNHMHARLPPLIFDAHAHIYGRGTLNPALLRVFKDGPPQVTIAAWRSHTRAQLGRSTIAGALLFPVPASPALLPKANEFLIDQLRTAPDCRGLILVAPSMRPADVEPLLAYKQIRGFKPYHTLIDGKSNYEAPLNKYLPEWVWRMADEYSLAITLHIVRSRSFADPVNLRIVREMCGKYPKARLILAHAGRGFNPATIIKAIPTLAEFQNIWFDSSAICETAALAAILRAFGPGRLMWGSDFPISCMRSKCVAAGDGFVWLNAPQMDWRKINPACSPAMVGVESTNALLQACDDVALNADDLQMIFHDNAMAMLTPDVPGTNRTQELYQHARERIPGGVNLLSKRPEMFAPEQWPPYFREARGCECWDLDGRHYYDFSLNGIMAALLGFRDPDVNRAVQRRINLGSWCTLNPPEEVELADLLCQIHPWADRVRFARTGGECAGVGVRIARATTDRSLIAVCGYHGWQDWYLAANLGDNNALRGHLLPGLDPFGVPEELRGSSLPFKYNDRQAFQAILDQHGSKLAAVVMEPCRYNDPDPGFLEFVRDGVHKAGGLLIFDEITIGWRLILGGAHRRYSVTPDIALFAKAIANGYPMAAIIGTKAAMEGAHKSFISSAFWTESIGPAAALATVKKMMSIDAPGYVARMGQLVIDAWKSNAIRHKVPLIVEEGFTCLPHFRFDHPLANELKTLFIQSMLERGFLGGPLFVPTMAHNEAIVARYATAVDEVLGLLRSAIDNDRIKEQLKGPAAHSGFRRLI